MKSSQMAYTRLPSASSTRLSTGEGNNLVSRGLTFRTCRMLRTWPPSSVTTQRATWRDQFLPARAGGTTLWRPVLSCMDAWLQHHCTPTQPPHALPSLSWWCQELMMTTSSQWGICRKKKKNISWLWLQPFLFLMSLQSWVDTYLAHNSWFYGLSFRMLYNKFFNS